MSAYFNKLLYIHLFQHRWPIDLACQSKPTHSKGNRPTPSTSAVATYSRTGPWILAWYTTWNRTTTPTTTSPLNSSTCHPSPCLTSRIPPHSPARWPTSGRRRRRTGRWWRRRRGWRWAWSLRWSPSRKVALGTRRLRWGSWRSRECRVATRLGAWRGWMTASTRWGSL